MRALNHLIAARRHRTEERGLALLDVLLGMAIFALIVVIGVQNFNTLRSRAQVTTVSSDVKQTGTAIEADRISDGAYEASLAATPTGVNLSPNVSLSGYTVAADGESFAVCAQHTGGAWAVYSSIKGAATATGATGGCTDTSATSAISAAVPAPAAAAPSAGPACPTIISISQVMSNRRVTLSAMPSNVSLYKVSIVGSSGTPRSVDAVGQVATFGMTSSGTMSTDKYIPVAVGTDGTQSTGCAAISFTDVYPPAP